MRRGGAPARTKLLRVLLARLVGQDLVEAAARLREQLLGAGDLGRVARGGHLEGGGADLGDEPAELEALLADARGRLGPRLAELLAVLLDVRRAGVGQGERRAALAGLGADSPSSSSCCSVG